MTFQKTIFFVLVSFILFGSSCKKSEAVGEDAILNIPSSTSSVTAINVKRLMEKADFEAVQKMDFYKNMLAKTTPSVAAVLKDPSQSGIDLDAHAYMIQDMDMSNLEKSFTGIVLSLKDKAAYEKLVTSGDSPKVETSDGFQYFQPERNVIVSWNDNIAVIGMSQSYRRVNLKEFVAKVFNTKKENSIAHNENLKKCFSKDADIVGWFGSDAMAEAAKGKMGMMAMAGFSPDMLKGSYAHSYFNFEKGEMVGNSEYEINDKLADEYRHLFKNKIKTDFSKYLPAENLAFAFAGGLDVKGISTILTNKGMSGMADFQLKEFGLSLAGLAKTFDGDFLVSGYRVEGRKNPAMMIATKINDASNFQKILELGIEYKIITNEGNGIYNFVRPDYSLRESFGDQPQIYVNDNMVFIGGATTSINALKSGNWIKNLVRKNIKNIFSDNIVAGFANFQTISKFLEMDYQDVDYSALEDATFRMDRDDATFKVELKDKSTNSLKSIFQWIDDTYKKQN